MQDSQPMLFGNKIYLTNDTISLEEIDEKLDDNRSYEIHGASVENLKTLKGCPENITLLYLCNSKLTTLEYCSENVNILYLYGNRKLKTLKGCPTYMTTLQCSNSRLESLVDGPKGLDWIIVDNNPQLILNDVWKHLQGCRTYEQEGRIHKDSGVLGLLRIPNIERIKADNNTPLKIVNTFLPLMTMSAILQCKQKLLNAGYESNATF